MDADWSVELGSHDPALDFPWRSPDGSLAYIDLKRHPERVTAIAEAVAYHELAKFLLDVNGAQSPLFSAKCDVWTADDLSEAESIYDAKLKFCSYVDLVFTGAAARFSFAQHEQFVKRAARVLNDPVDPCDDELSVAAEFVVRRCWYAANGGSRDAGTNNPVANLNEPCEGFYVTFYLFGYGNNEADARLRWGQGLELASAIIARFAG